MRRTVTECCARVVACALLLAPASARAQRTAPITPSAAPLERARGTSSAGYLVRPRDLSQPRPVTVYLHGICGVPEHGCPQFREGVSDRSWLLCPSAPVRCEGGGSAWGPRGSSNADAVRALVAEAARLAPGGVDRARPGVLIGFSQGAYVAERMLRSAEGRGRWRGVVFIGGFIRSTRAQLEGQGVRRVVLAAGRNDMTRATLEETARRLQNEGFPARFVDLGAVGHTYVPARNVAGWRDALAWLEETY